MAEYVVVVAVRVEAPPIYSRSVEKFVHALVQSNLLIGQRVHGSDGPITVVGANAVTVEQVAE